MNWFASTNKRITLSTPQIVDAHGIHATQVHLVAYSVISMIMAENYYVVVPEVFTTARMKDVPGILVTQVTLVEDSNSYHQMVDIFLQQLKRACSVLLIAEEHGIRDKYEMTRGDIQNWINGDW